jgi:hypothetical protein
VARRVEGMGVNPVSRMVEPDVYVEETFPIGRNKVGPETRVLRRTDSVRRCTDYRVRT